MIEDGQKMAQGSKINNSDFTLLWAWVGLKKKVHSEAITLNNAFSLKPKDKKGIIFQNKIYVNKPFPQLD